MYKKLSTKVIWVDFKTKRIFDISKTGQPDKKPQPIPWLCRIDKRKIEVSSKKESVVKYYDILHETLN